VIRNNRVANGTLDDSEWNFMDVLDVQGNNYEYFNDIRDIDFEKKKPIMASDWFAIASLISVIILGSLVVILATGVFRDDGYKDVLAMQSVQQSLNQTYVDGEEVGSSELLAISNVLNEYFTVLSAEEDYTPLSAYCMGSSSFADTYYANTAKVVEFYDSNDCYARALRRFASFCRCNEVTKVLKKNDVYYCYFRFSFPSSSDIQSYIHSNSYFLTKYFTGKSITEENIMMCFLEMSSQGGMSYHTEEYCVKFQQRGTDYAMINDSFMVDVCSNAYSEYLKQCSSVLGGKQISK